MFVRKKKNRSGSTSIAVVNKMAKRVIYIKTIGISSDELEIEQLFHKGQEYVYNLGDKEIYLLITTHNSMKNTGPITLFLT